MAAIVLVHGVDNQRESADLIESGWLPALAGGVRLAGRPDLADRLWPPRSRADSIDCRAAYYGDLFRPPDRQGAGDDLRDLTPEQAALAEALALEWLGRVAERAPAGGADADQARLALEIARDPEAAGAQGRGNVLRGALKTLSRSPLIAGLGMGLAERFVVPALAQVARDLSAAPSQARSPLNRAGISQGTPEPLPRSSQIRGPLSRSAPRKTPNPTPLKSICIEGIAGRWHAEWSRPRPV